MKTQVSKKFVAALVIVLSLSTTRSAWGAGDAQASHKLDRKVVMACERSLQLPLRDVTHTAAEVANIHTCIKQYRANVMACAESSKIDVTGGQVPPADVQAYRSCEEVALKSI